MGRCDYCRSPCGFRSQPAVVLPSTLILCLSCYQDRLDEAGEHDATGWVSSDDEPVYGEDGEEIHEDDGPSVETEDEPEVEPEPKRQRST